MIASGEQAVESSVAFDETLAESIWQYVVDNFDIQGGYEISYDGQADYFSLTPIVGTIKRS